ncbi:hypothetical protein [Neobacillus niacini]|nr:hypothetical protein [Neobacillus niacini]MDR7002043.1 hypothetical protein [Neobacillus niacini]
MKIGDVVIFNGKKYKIEWVYDSGYCEVRHIENKNIVFVTITDLQPE